MESMTHDDVVMPTSSQQLEDDQLRVILKHFIRATLTMRHVDEVFLWVTNLMVQRFRARVAQVWATHMTRQGSFFPILRSSARQDQSLPQSLIVNPQIAAIAENTLRARQSTSLALVDMAFPPRIAPLLHLYGLNYCASLFFSNPELLLPAATDVSNEQIPTPLTISLVLFFHQVPLQNELLSVSNVFHQILPIAKGRGLLLASPVNVKPLPAVQDAAPGLFELIVERNEDPADNPLAASVAITDTSARRFYAAINNQRTVRELCMLAHLESKEAAAIIEMLLTQNRIQLHEPGEQVLENVRIFSDH